MITAEIASASASAVVSGTPFLVVSAVLTRRVVAEHPLLAASGDSSLGFAVALCSSAATVSSAPDSAPPSAA